MDRRVTIRSRRSVKRFRARPHRRARRIKEVRSGKRFKFFAISNQRRSNLSAIYIELPKRPILGYDGEHAEPEAWHETTNDHYR